MKKRTMKRSIAMGLAVITAAGCLTGCGGSENQASTDANGRYNLKVMTYDYSGNPMKGETGAEIIEKVEDYTGVNLDVMWTPKDNYNELVVERICPRLLQQKQSLLLSSMQQKPVHCGI